METVTIQVEGSAFRWVLTALPMALNQLPSDKRAGITVRPLSTGFASDLDPSLVIGGLNVLATLLPCLIQLIQRLLADGNKPLTGSRITLTAEVAPTQTLHYNAREKSKTASQDSIIEDPLTFLLEAINDDEDNCFPIAVRRTISQQPWHPVLKPYIEKKLLRHIQYEQVMFLHDHIFIFTK